MSVNEAFNMKRLVAGGIKQVIVPYSGGGDDGHVDHSGIESEPPMDFSDRQRRMMADVVYSIISECGVPDWCNNDGGQGQVVFTLREDKRLAWSLHHETNYTTEDKSKAEGVIEDNSLSPELVLQLDAICKEEQLQFRKEHPEYNKDEPMYPVGVHYYGSGGGIDEMHCFVRKENHEEVDPTPMVETAEKLLDKHFPDWQSEDGGSGDVHFEVRDGKIHYDIDHCTYTRTHEDEEHEGVLGDDSEEESREVEIEASQPAPEKQELIKD